MNNLSGKKPRHFLSIYYLLFSLFLYLPFVKIVAKLYRDQFTRIINPELSEYYIKPRPEACTGGQAFRPFPLCPKRGGSPRERPQKFRFLLLLRYVVHIGKSSLNPKSFWNPTGSLPKFNSWTFFEFLDHLLENCKNHYL